MIECIIYDETDYAFPDSRTEKAVWTQSFSRVPCKGEYITKLGCWLKVERVVWDSDRVRLAVKWDGGLD